MGTCSDRSRSGPRLPATGKWKSWNRRDALDLDPTYEPTKPDWGRFLELLCFGLRKEVWRKQVLINGCAHSRLGEGTEQDSAKTFSVAAVDGRTTRTISSFAIICCGKASDSAWKCIYASARCCLKRLTDFFFFVWTEHVLLPSSRQQRQLQEMEMTSCW